MPTCARTTSRPTPSEAQKEQYLPGLCDGTQIGALALTEPEAGSDAMGIRTTAVRDGDFYRLNGSKMFITNGSVADTLVLYAKTDPEAGSAGVTAFIVESVFAGFSVGQVLDKVGTSRFADGRADPRRLRRSGRKRVAR